MTREKDVLGHESDRAQKNGNSSSDIASTVNSHPTSEILPDNLDETPRYEIEDVPSVTIVSTSLDWPLLPSLEELCEEIPAYVPPIITSKGMGERPSANDSSQASVEQSKGSTNGFVTLPEVSENLDSSTTPEQGRVSPNELVCPECNAELERNYDELQCMTCGYYQERRLGEMVEEPTVETSSQLENLEDLLLFMICPRCDKKLHRRYDEISCPTCGFRRDVESPRRTRGGEKTAVNDGTRYILRYIGDSDSLSQTLVHVQLQRMRNRVVYKVSCPFCTGQMIQSSLSGKRREVREERYKCTKGHRVSFAPAENGSLGWK